MKIQGELNTQTITAFKGVIDCYFYKGRPVARAWPKTPNQPNTQAQLDARKRLTDAVAWAKQQTTYWSNAWKQSNNTTGRSYRDRYLSEAIRQLKKSPLLQCPSVLSSELTKATHLEASSLTLTMLQDPQVDWPRWSVAIRGQAPDDNALSYYDGGWFIDRCLATYKLYLPIFTGFRPYNPDPPTGSPLKWKIPLMAEPDAVSFFLYQNDKLDQIEEQMLWPPTKVIR